MAMRNKGRKTYRTMQGKQIDLDMLIKRNELTPAVGNAKVNARGDELGPGGKIVRKREEVVRDYYKRPAKESTKAQQFQPPAEPDITAQEAEMLDEFDDGWVEDADGNFVKKGE